MYAKLLYKTAKMTQIELLICFWKMTLKRFVFHLIKKCGIFRNMKDINMQINISILHVTISGNG